MTFELLGSPGMHSSIPSETASEGIIRPGAGGFTGALAEIQVLILFDVPAGPLSFRPVCAVGAKDRSIGESQSIPVDKNGVVTNYRQKRIPSQHKLPQTLSERRVRLTIGNSP
jgi:hypothetical protein